MPVLTRNVTVEKRGHHGDTEGTEFHGEKGEHRLEKGIGF
jgi:hypothetical protein